MSSFEINVKFPSNPNLKIQLESDNTVAELKQKLEEATKVPLNEIKLIFKGKILKVLDDKMADLGIEKDCTVHMIRNMPQTSSDNTSNQTNTSNTQQTPPQANTFPNPNPAFGFGGLGNQGFPGMGFPGMGGLGPQGMNPQMMQQMMSNPQVQAMTRQLLQNPDMLRNMINNNPQLQQMTQNIPGFETMIQDPSLVDNLLGQFPAQPPTQQPEGQTPPQNQQPQGQQIPVQMPDLSSMMNNPMMQQYINAMGGTQPQTNPFMAPPQQNVNYEELYKDQLLHLKEMGFTNKEVNIEVLKKSFGNVEADI